MYQLLSLCLLLLFSLNTACAQDFLLFDGEIPTVSSCNFPYGAADSTQAFAGNYCFEGIPDQWHAPGIHLGCQNAWRSDLSGFDELWLYAKATEPGKKIHLGFYGWPYTSHAVDIDPYGPAPLDTVYQLFKIPLDSLRTASYSLASVEILYFGASMPGDTHHIFVDEIWAVDLTPNTIVNHKIISEKVLRLDVKDRYDTTQVQQLNAYNLQSNTDSNYLTAQAPTQNGMHYYVKGFEDITTQAVVKLQNELFLEFPYAFKNGHTYTLTVQNIADLSGNAFPHSEQRSIQYNDQTLISGTVKANHIGYQPDAPKYGYVGNYLGSSGALNISVDSFELRDSLTHAKVYGGQAVLKGADDRLSGEYVYECDFSTFNTEGAYYLYVPGAGRSFSFSIDSQVYNQAFYVSARGLFYQRHDAINSPYAANEYARGGCPDLAEIDISHSSSAAFDAATDYPVGTQMNISGGWLDAGDYGRYVPTAALAVNLIMTAYEIYPQRFTDNFLNIPESGNGVPDLLDEARVELDWLLQMQAPDGGVYFKVTTPAYAGSMPAQDTFLRYIAEKTTFSTGHFAAVMAQAYRVYQAYDTAYADTCLSRAVRAWQFLLNHPTAIPVGGFSNLGYGGGGTYGDPGGDVDERAWAAAELYKTTGDTAYHSAFEYYWLQHAPDWGWNEFQHHQRRASWAYCTTDFPIDSTYFYNYVNLVELGMDNYHIPRANSNIYRNSYRSDVIPWIGWGSYAQSTKYVWEFIKGYHLVPKPQYLDYARLNFDAQLGNNPMNKSYITGLGYDGPTSPTHAPSQYDTIDAPVPGLPVFGPHSHIPMSNAFYYAAQYTGNLYPAGEQDLDPYPTLRRYYDCHQLVHMSEFTIDYQAMAAVCFARFCTYDTSIVTPNTNIEAQKLELKAYPTPTQDVLILDWQLPLVKKAQIMISNVHGQLIDVYNAVESQKMMEINVRKLIPGIYFCALYFEGQHLSTSFVKF